MGIRLEENPLESGSNPFYGEYYWMSGLPILLNCFESLVINTREVKENIILLKHVKHLAILRAFIKIPIRII